MAGKNKPPGNWSHDATVRFYEAHNGDVHEMIRTIRKWDYIDDPGGFAAQIADYVRGTTYWRGPPEAKANPLFKGGKKTDWCGGWEPKTDNQLDDGAEKLAEGETLKHIQTGFRDLDGEIYDQFKLDTTKKGNVKLTLTLLDLKVEFEKALEYRKEHGMGPQESYRNPRNAPDLPSEHPSARKNPDIANKLVQGAYHSEVNRKRELRGYLLALFALSETLPAGEIKKQVEIAASSIQQNLTKGGRLKKRALKYANPSGEFPTEHPSTFKNPSKEYSDKDVQHAIDIFKSFNGYEPREVQMGTIVAPSTLVFLGFADRLTYLSDKHGHKKDTRHEHEFKRAKVWFDKDNKAIWMQGGIKVTKYGIEG